MQATPRRLESRRGLDKSLTERALEKTDNSQKSTTSTTTTTTIFNLAVVTVQNFLPSTPESNSSGSQKNDPSKSTN